MISDFVKKRVSEIETKTDFDEYMNGVKMSTASFEEKQKVIEYCQKVHPMYSEADRTPTDEIRKEIEAGQADISDMGGF